MLLDKYKRDYKIKSDQKDSNKYLKLSVIISFVLIIALWYFFG